MTSEEANLLHDERARVGALRADIAALEKRIGELRVELATARERNVHAHAEAEAVLTMLGSEAVRVRANGGGLEDSFASLAASVAKLLRERDRLRAQLAEARAVHDGAADADA